ncbi:conserved hypothetical protein [Histoplasma capsulatum H143]|uniref:N-acetyltransferase domain-containing protein n=1 Tax=Ajellomyces capsulatus (strain H143) TaxID=544712 RepID=C6HS43_AJECH|nr:conserved hypothetical protein [Histoplasma capsulatum H143]
MSNPTNNHSSRFEIRQLRPEHIEWAKAVHSHSNSFFSPIWPKLYPNLPPWRIHDFFSAFDHLVRHQIESGLSYGIFDTEYKFKDPGSAKTGGKLYWEQPTTDIEKEATTQQSLLDQMDFPLVSIALSFDPFNPFEMEKMMSLFALAPEFAFINAQINERDTRDPAMLEDPSAPGQILRRNSTATRADYMGLGLMKMLSHHLMNEAAGKGFREIKIETFSDAVFRVWTNPPSPYKAEVVCELNLKEFAGEVEVFGQTLPFEAPWRNGNLTVSALDQDPAI